MDHIDEGETMPLSEFERRLPAFLAMFSDATNRYAATDETFSRARTFEDWLREMVAYEACCRLEEELP